MSSISNPRAYRSFEDIQKSPLLEHLSSGERKDVIKKVGTALKADIAADERRAMLKDLKTVLSRPGVWEYLKPLPRAGGDKGNLRQINWNGHELVLKRVLDAGKLEFLKTKPKAKSAILAGGINLRDQWLLHEVYHRLRDDFLKPSKYVLVPMPAYGTVTDGRGNYYLAMPHVESQPNTNWHTPEMKEFSENLSKLSPYWHSPNANAIVVQSWQALNIGKTNRGKRIFMLPIDQL